MSDEMNELGQKKAYAFDPETREFLGDVWADPDQLNSGQFLLPAHATFDCPPETETNEAAVWDGKLWSCIADYRGTEYWDEEGSKQLVIKLGDQVPEGAHLKGKPSRLSVTKQTALAEAECSRRIELKWNLIGQINAALGVYNAAEIKACKKWVSDHRDSLLALLARGNLIELDVSDDQYWPS